MITASTVFREKTAIVPFAQSGKIIMHVIFQMSENSKKNMDTTELEEVKQEIEGGSGDGQNGEDTSMGTNNDEAASIKDLDGLDDDFIKKSEPGET